MTDIPVLHAGDQIFVVCGPGLAALERRSLTAAFLASGVKIVDWRVVSMAGYAIVAVVRATPEALTIRH